MNEFVQPSFTEDKYSLSNSWRKKHALPPGMIVERAQTQTDVNTTVLNHLVQKFLKQAPLNILDLPCGNMEFTGYLHQLFPLASIIGIDVVVTQPKQGVQFLQMDVSQPFTIPEKKQYDIITSISGVMMFSNTQLFLQQSIRRLKNNGTFVLTNDNSSTLKDKLSYLMFGSLRMFPAVYADTEEVTENVSIQELVRLLRINNMVIRDIVYTSANAKDFLLWPLALLLYPLQRWYLRRYKNKLPPELIRKMYPFGHLYCRHYSIFAEKAT